MSDLIDVRVWHANGAVESFRRLADRTLWVGREARCDVVLRDGRVSRRHVAVDLRGAELHVCDASRNGIVVNSQPVHRTTVVAGRAARIEIGAHHLELTVVPAAELTAASPAHGPSLQQPATTGLSAAQRRLLHRALLDHLDLSAWSDAKTPASRSEVRAALERVLDQHAGRLPAPLDRARVIEELADEALGLGPLEPLMADPQVSEIMVVDPRTIYVERNGRIERVGTSFTDDDAVRAVIERIVTPLGRRIDESVPMVDARLPDGSRVHAIIAPLAVKGAAITIRRFPRTSLTMDDLVARGCLSDAMATLLRRAVAARKNILIAGGTGSGKTTLLNVLAAHIAGSERVVTIEDAAELKLPQTHVVALEARPPSLEGQSAITIRELVRNALRMRPDRIVVGECRGGEALDMLQAMNTGHDGSMTTLHANHPREAVARLETLCLMAGLDLPVSALRAQIAASIHLIVQQSRYADGSRRVSSVAEVVGIDDDGQVRVAELHRFRPDGYDANGRVCGAFLSTGLLPTFAAEWIRIGIASAEECL